ncbi:MAG: hypothetical protein ACFB03_09880 [Paracoccaceae bacterium]
MHGTLRVRDVFSLALRDPALEPIKLTPKALLFELRADEFLSDLHTGTGG